jgi:ABC-type sugar transport system ATPase subunit
MAAITLDGLTKTYPNGHAAVRDVSLPVADGELLVLLGPSGCGKSTLLRLIAGLDAPTAGRILLDGTDVTPLSPQARDLAMVFQSYALYPHMSVRQNLAYGLRVRGIDAAAIVRRVDSVADALALAPLLDRRPAQLSGGQRQRVALGRALVREPKAFLLDEPLSNLDPALRVQARTELLRLQQRLGATIVYVTHDQEEAMTLGHRVAVMRDGRIEQAAPPLELYHEPANTFVASFVGTPAMNLLPGPIPELGVAADVTAGIRPHDLRLEGSGPLAARVELVEPRGHDAIVHLTARAGRQTRLVAVVGGSGPERGASVRLSVPAGRLLLFDGSGRRRTA